MRLFNVYGPGQALSNPYTGVLAIFASRLAATASRPDVFEDGEQRRDFVHVDDVARAFVLALERPEAVGEVFNIGSGQDRQHPARSPALAAAMGRPEIEPEITRQVPHRRHPPLLRRHLAGASRSGFARAGRFRGQPRRARGVGRAAAGASIASRRRARELEARGLVA